MDEKNNCLDATECGNATPRANTALACAHQNPGWHFGVVWFDLQRRNARSARMVLSEKQLQIIFSEELIQK